MRNFIFPSCLFISSFLLFLLPSYTYASVIINEVAWMGSDNGGTSGQNSNDEWIELYNTSSEKVFFSGWKIETIDGGSPEIELEGEIEGNGYYLLERTDDESVPGILAHMFYSGALSNTGEHLLLKDDTGTIVNEVNFLEGWMFGDNTTKETMQWTGSEWVTALGTPLGKNTGQSSEVENNPDEVATETSESPQSSYYKSETPSLTVFIKERDTVLLSGAQAVFEGMALGILNEPIENARFMWNFGDGSTKEGKKLLHTYFYPGTYVVLLSVSSGEYSGSARVTLEVIPADIEIIEVGSGRDDFIKIKNNTPSDIDLGGWLLKSGKKFYALPFNTVLLSGKSVIFPKEVTGLLNTGDEIALLYPNGISAHIYSGKVAEKPRTIFVSPEISYSESKAPVVENKKTEVILPLVEEEVLEVQALVSDVDIPQQSSKNNSSIWYISMFALVLVGGVTFIFVRKSKPEPLDEEEKLAEEIDIVEEKE